LEELPGKDEEEIGQAKDFAGELDFNLGEIDPQATAFCECYEWQARIQHDEGEWAFWQENHAYSY